MIAYGKLGKFMIKIKTLVENSAISKEYKSKHGLSLYIETAKHKILFDLGQDGLFVENAKKMGVDIADIDTVIISHGHKDHGGGLKHLLSLNDKAKIYVRKDAFDKHFIKVLGLKIGVGLDEKLKANNRIIFTDETTVIDDELMLFSNVEMGEYRSDSNGKLYAKTGNEIALDNFSHEQNLIIKDEDRVVLVSGCSHAGIENILKRAEQLVDGQVDAVVGGFHLYNPPTRKYEEDERIEKVANALGEFSCHYYTCHCTGIKAFDKMKTRLGSRLDYLHTGSEIDL